MAFKMKIMILLITIVVCGFYDCNGDYMTEEEKRIRNFVYTEEAYDQHKPCSNETRIFMHIFYWDRGYHFCGYNMPVAVQTICHNENYPIPPDVATPRVPEISEIKVKIIPTPIGFERRRRNKHSIVEECCESCCTPRWLKTHYCDKKETWKEDTRHFIYMPRYAADINNKN